MKDCPMCGGTGKVESEGKAEPGDRPAEERGEPSPPKKGGQFALKKQRKRGNS